MIHEDNFYIHALRAQLSYDFRGLIYATVYAETTNGARTPDGPQNHFNVDTNLSPTVASFLSYDRLS